LWENTSNLKYPKKGESTMTAKLKSDALRVVKRLRCYGTDAEDNFGCGDKRCKYRDVDGACNINSLEADAAEVIEKLLKEVEKFEHR
jgi:hypothetical protein